MYILVELILVVVVNEWPELGKANISFLLLLMGSTCALGKPDSWVMTYNVPGMVFLCLIVVLCCTLVVLLLLGNLLFTTMFFYRMISTLIWSLDMIFHDTKSNRYVYLFWHFQLEFPHFSLYTFLLCYFMVKEFLNANEIILTYSGDLFTLWDWTRGEFIISSMSFCVVCIVVYEL